jgi:hypothetical protein
VRLPRIMTRDGKGKLRVIKEFGYSDFKSKLS